MEVQQIDFFELLHLLARNKQLIMRVVLGSALVGLIVALAWPPTYRAESRFVPPQQNQGSASALLGQLGSLGGLAGLAASRDLPLKNPADLYIGLLKSRSIADALINRHDLTDVYGIFRKQRMSEAREELADRSVIVASKEGVVSVSVEDRQPWRAAALANAYIEELQAVNKRLALGEAAQRRLFYEKELEVAKDRLSEAEVQMRITQEKTGLILPEGQAQALIETVARLKQDIASKEVNIQSMRSYATSENPTLIQQQQQLAALRAQLNKLESQQDSGNGNLQIATKKIPSVGLEYVRRYRDVRYRETLFEVLAKQYEAAKIDEAKNAPVIQVLDPAVVPDKRVKPLRWVIIMLAAFLGFLGAVVWLLTQNKFERLLIDEAAERQWQNAKNEFSSGWNLRP